MTIWTGLVSREYAERVMQAVAVAGGFVATDMPLDGDRGRTVYLAALPHEFGPPPADSTAIPMAEFRARLIRENSAKYLGRDHKHADKQGFACESRIANLLERLAS